MHHLYPTAVKGDPLCPLGFHPQVRWPTRCKRCFRDYKEHGSRTKDDLSIARDDTTSSSPALSSWRSTSSRYSDDSGRSSSSKADSDSKPSSNDVTSRRNAESPGVRSDGARPALSWTSTPDLGNLREDARVQELTVSLTLPRRRPATVDTGQDSVSSYSLRRRTTDLSDISSSLSSSDSSNATNTTAEKSQTARKPRKKQNSSSSNKDLSEVGKQRRLQIQSLKEVRSCEETANPEVEFIIQVKSSKNKSSTNHAPNAKPPSGGGDPTARRSRGGGGSGTSSSGSSSASTDGSCDDDDDDDLSSLAGTETTETTLVDRNETEMLEQIESLKTELEMMRARCERVEREKSDILLSRIASMHTSSNKTAASEVLKLQQKVNELQARSEDLADENRSTSLRVRELEEELEARPDPATTKRIVDDLQSKVLAAETLCEELMDENEDMKKELRDLEEEIEEMQDNFREEQADEYASLKKELEQTAKNCRILSFKLRKAERKCDQIEAEKLEADKKCREMAGGVTGVEKIKQLEEELARTTQEAARLQKELEEVNEKLKGTQKSSNSAEEDAKKTKKRAPMLGTIAKIPSSEKVSRDSLTRGGSQEDPAQLLRDLQDSLEREADLREQLRYAEEEAEAFRKKASRVEDDNESLQLQLKKMAAKSRSRKQSPIPAHSAADVSKTEVSDDTDPAELKLLLELSEQESTVLRRKMDKLESENENLKQKLKDSQDVLNTSPLKNSVETTGNKFYEQKIKMERDDKDLTNSLKRLKEDALRNTFKFLGQRKPRKPTEFTTKLQLKKMVEELETEIGEVSSLLKKYEEEKIVLLEEAKSTRNQGGFNNDKEAQNKLERNLQEATEKVKSLEKSLKEEKDKSLKDKKSSTKEKKSLDEEKKKLQNDIKKLAEDNKNLEKETAKHKEELNSFRSEVSKLEDGIADLKSEKANLLAKQDEMTVQLKKFEALKKKAEEEERTTSALRKQLESATQIKQEKNELSKQVLEKNRKITEAEKQVKELEEKLKKGEASMAEMKEKILKLEKELELERKKIKASENSQQDITKSFMKERSTLESQVETLQSKIVSLENTIAKKASLIEQLEAKLKEEQQSARNAASREGAEEKKRVSVLKEELEQSEKRLKDVSQKMEKAEKQCKTYEEKLSQLESDTQKEKLKLEKQVTDLETSLKAEKKKLDVAKAKHQKESKNRDQELASLRAKLSSLENNSGVTSKRVAEMEAEYRANVAKIYEELSTEKEAYENLTSKYEMLEEEHVITKSRLVQEKESVQRELASVRRDLSSARTEVEAVRDSHSSKQAQWIKERAELQEKAKQLAEKLSRASNDSFASERNRLKAALEEKSTTVEQARRELDVLADQMGHVRKENEELRRKLEDFDKVSKVHQTMKADATAFEKELRETKTRHSKEEKNHKAEIAQLKMRYDSRVAIISEEIQSLQGQVSRFKRERDTFRHMLESAQERIAELKSSPGSPASGKSARSDEAEETKTKIATLEQQVSCMEDELSEARLESSKLKTELISERSAWDVKLSEMQSRVNELEEERILTSGRSKIPGLRTRMELAWHKERDEQHRLLQETSTLARDLRQTLFEVERERDKERLEAKRRQDQLKKINEEEQEENRRKLTELQSDLLELRDAHAKLRHTNEKLRRDKERLEKEREDWRQQASGKKRTNHTEETKMNTLLEQVEELVRIAPDLMQQKDRSSSIPPPPTPPLRLKGPKSKESSPSLERKEFKKEPSVSRQTQFQSTVLRLAEVAEELRKYQRLTDEERERERVTRAAGFRRAASTESQAAEVRLKKKPSGDARAASQKGGKLVRKSLSLEHTGAQQEQSIWKDANETDGSYTSLQSIDDARSQIRNINMDSRLSGGSTQSDVGHDTKKQKKGIFGKLKKLTKSKSVDETNRSNEYLTGVSAAGSGSDISMSAEEKGSKKDLGERISGIFRKANRSRSSSLERGAKLPKEKGPLTRHADSAERTVDSSRTSSSSTLPRPSGARTESRQTSSISRPLAANLSSTHSSTSGKTPLHRFAK